MIIKTLSLVVPCYNEANNIHQFFNTVESLQLNFDLEYIFINDGSQDDTLNILRELHLSRPDSVRYLSFSRNFGKESAIFAGLQASSGDYVVLLDADLQHPPHLLEEMTDILTQGNYDSVAAVRATRTGESKFRALLSSLFYKVLNLISETEISQNATDFRMMSRKMVEAVLELSEVNRFTKGIFSWVGFDTYHLEYENVTREEGESSWSFWKLFTYSIDGIVSFSAVPLRIASVIGIISFIVAILMALYYSVRTLIFGSPLSGWPTLVILLLGMGGLQLFSLGILGEYLGRVFMESKNRPIYILKETEKDLEHML